MSASNSESQRDRIFIWQEFYQRQIQNHSATEFLSGRDFVSAKFRITARQNFYLAGILSASNSESRRDKIFIWQGFSHAKFRITAQQNFYLAEILSAPNSKSPCDRIFIWQGFSHAKFKITARQNFYLAEILSAPNSESQCDRIFIWQRFCQRQIQSECSARKCFFNSTVNFVPTPNFESTEIFPSCRRRISVAIESPSPLPPASRERALSTR